MKFFIALLASLALFFWLGGLSPAQADLIAFAPPHEAIVMSANTAQYATDFIAGGSQLGGSFKVNGGSSIEDKLRLPTEVSPNEYAKLEKFGGPGISLTSVTVTGPLELFTSIESTDSAGRFSSFQVPELAALNPAGAFFGPIENAGSKSTSVFLFNRSSFKASVNVRVNTAVETVEVPANGYVLYQVKAPIGVGRLIVDQRFFGCGPECVGTAVLYGFVTVDAAGGGHPRTLTARAN
jgi:hypothetical protein